MNTLPSGGIQENSKPRDTDKQFPPPSLSLSHTHTHTHTHTHAGPKGNVLHGAMDLLTGTMSEEAELMHGAC